MRNILVYQDEGVAAIQQLLSALSEALPQISVQTVNPYTLISEAWEETTALLVIPGGRDVSYHANLQGVGNNRIASYVSNGGNYLGICAGGYYGAAYIEFEKGGELEVCGSRELAFFPGRAIGPVYGHGLFDYESERGAREAQLIWEGGECPVYYNGGCLFEHPEKYPAVEVLARYRDLPEAPAAVIKCHIGQGKAILSGAHPEFSVSSFEEKREIFWHHILEQLLIKN